MTGNSERRCQGGAQSGACAAHRRASNTLTPKVEEARGALFVRREPQGSVPVPPGHKLPRGESSTRDALA